VAGIKNPSYLVVSKDKKNVYSVNEIGNGKGSVSAFSFDPPTGKLEFLNTASSGGNGPCYITVDDDKKYAFAGNYGGGSLSAIPIRKDGSFGPAIQSIRHQGSSINMDQSRSHVHATVLSDDNKQLFVPDLGTDRLHIYNVDSANPNPLSVAEQAYASIEEGSGPRHFTFHPNGKYGYVIQELTGKVTVFDYQDGKLKEKQVVSIIPDTYSGKVDGVGAADIHISPDGNFLYGSLRGDTNEIVIYSIDASGSLKYAGRQSTLGSSPRNFAIDPTGNFLLVGNSGNDEIVIFKRDQQTGLLIDTDKRIAIGSPVCLKFVSID